MRSSSRAWTIVSTLSLITTILLLCGFVYAVQDIANPSAGSGMKLSPISGDQNQTVPQAGQLSVVVIGDSLAKGTGDDEGKGFAQRAVELLQNQNKQQKVQLLGNLGINGLTTAGLSDELKESGVQHMLKSANVILLSIGGNDLFQGADALQNEGGLPTAEQLNQAIDSASNRFKSAIQQLKDINPAADLVYIGLYNPFYDLDEMRQLGSSGVGRWNSMAQELLTSSEKSVVVPTYDLFEMKLPQYLSSDHFHPNGDGYQQIAARIVQSLG